MLEERVFDDIDKTIDQLGQAKGKRKGIHKFQPWLKLVFYFAILVVFSTEEFQIKQLGTTINQLQTSVNNSNNYSSSTRIENNNNIGTGLNADAQVRSDEKVVLGIANAFDPSKWIIDSNFSQDSQGFYCPQISGFDYWSIWSKDKFSVNFSSVKIRFKLKNLTNASVLPMVVFSYGEYSQNLSPSTDYRVNLFDGGKNVIRVYDSDNKSNAQVYFDQTPSLDGDMVLTISPRVPDPTGSKLVLNPILDYFPNNSAKQAHYLPSKDLAVNLKSVDLEDGSIQGQIGIGVQRNSCIKILSVEIH